MFPFIWWIFCLIVFACKIHCYDYNQTEMDINSTIAFTPVAWDNETINRWSMINSSLTTTVMEAFTDATFDVDNWEMQSTSESTSIDSLASANVVVENFIASEWLESHGSLVEHLQRIFCSIRTMFLYVYVENRVSSPWANDIIRRLSDCSSSGVIVVRFVECIEARSSPVVIRVYLI